jgi:glycosyltransferase involved in cell wall biosynthesis
MTEPLISIVLPTYNGSEYIRASIESCLEQTFTNFELIIVNDCSTDNTPEIIAEYAEKDERIRIIHNGQNKKLPLSLNAGFDAARGKYHTWTSDDNYYSPDALQTLFEILEKHNEAGLVYTDYSIINDRNEITGKRSFNDVYNSFTNWLGCGACFLYKAVVYKTNNGYNPSAFLIEDYDFFMRAFLTYKFIYHPSFDLYYYREHPASLTSTQGDMVNYISKMMVERQLPLLEKKLPTNQLSLLYRKFAVFNAVQKNNFSKYGLYIEKMWTISKSQVLLTVFYVVALKLWLALKAGAKGIAALFSILMNKK